MTREETIRQCYQVPGQMWPVELGWLYDTFSKSRSHAEIGTYCGRSLLASCAGMHPSSRAVSVDDGSQWQNPKWVEQIQAATINLLNVTVTQIRCRSIHAARECQLFGRTFDSIFIDADHHYAECRADIEAWMPLLKPGGIICGHDYWTQDVGVMEAVNEVFEGRHSVVPGTRIWIYHAA
jgi:predicted O-methyltransferase YrrM